MQGHLVELGLTPYLDAWELQRTLAEFPAEAAGEIEPLSKPDELVALDIFAIVHPGHRKLGAREFVPAMKVPGALQPETGAVQPAIDTAGCHAEAGACVGNEMPVLLQQVVEFEARHHGETVHVRG